MKLEGLAVQHKTLGAGAITKFDGKYITVSFKSKVSMFPYPNIFTTYLQAKDPAEQAAILKEIEEAKNTVIAQQKAIEDKKRAEAEKQIAETVAQKNKNKATAAPKKMVQKRERIDGKPMTFYVFQGSTFEREFQGGYLWAPITNKAGDCFHHWDCLLEVRPGDIILHGYNGSVQAVSIAKAACYDCIQPKELRTEDSWDMEGRRVDCEYIRMEHPVKTSDYTEDIIRLCNTKYSPFNKYGSGNMGYLYEINRQMAKIFLQASVAANPYLKENQVISVFLAE